MKKMLPAIYAILLLVLIEISLAFGGVGFVLFKGSEDIDRKVIEKVHVLNRKVIKNIINNDYKAQFDLLTEEKKRRADIDSIKNIYSGIHNALQNKDFIQKEDYYFSFSGTGNHIFPVTVGDISKFRMEIALIDGKDRIVSFMETIGETVDLVLIFIWELNKGQWRLDRTSVGKIRFYGKDAIEWLSVAEKMWDKGHHVPALVRIAMSIEVLKPAPYIHYLKEDEIFSLANKYQKGFDKNSLPKTLNVDGKPVIFDIKYSFSEKRPVHQVYFLSNHNISNHSIIKSEAKKMVPAVEKLFPGLFSYGDMVVMKATNVIPTNDGKPYRAFPVPVKE